MIGAFLLFVAVCAAASFSWIYGSRLAAGPPIRSDGMGYYLYLPAVMLDRDVTLERTAERSFAGRTWEMEGVRRVAPRDRYLDKYPLGEAIMLVPFFVLGDVVARVLGARTDPSPLRISGRPPPAASYTPCSVSPSWVSFCCAGSPV